MGWLSRKVFSSDKKRDYGHIRKLLDQEFGVSERHINKIERTELDNDLQKYTATFDIDFISEKRLREFVYYNDSYRFKRKSDTILIQRTGDSGSFTVDEIDSFPYELEIEYFKKDELDSDTKSRMKFMHKYSQYRENGTFKFA